MASPLFPASQHKRKATQALVSPYTEHSIHRKDISWITKDDLDLQSHSHIIENEHGTSFRMVYHSPECHRLLRDDRVYPHMVQIGLARLEELEPWGFDLPRCIQFITTFNPNRGVGTIRGMQNQAISQENICAALHLPYCEEKYT